MASLHTRCTSAYIIAVCLTVQAIAAPRTGNDNNSDNSIETSKLSAMDLIIHANMEETSGVASQLGTIESNVRHLIEGDIVPSKKRNAVGIDAWKWTGHRIPYEINTDGFSTYGLKIIQEAIDQFNSDVSCIKYVPRQKEQDYVRIVHGYGCHSSIGRDGGRQDVTLGDNCYYKGVVMHELTHAVGFFHEQSRYDRDSYVEVKWENIMDGKDRDFVKESRNILDTLDSPYDYGSIMHYGAYTFSKNNQPTLKALYDDKGTMGQRDGFSSVDIWKINKLYKCTKGDAPDPVWMGGVTTKLSSTLTVTTPSTVTPSTVTPSTSTVPPTKASTIPSTVTPSTASHTPSTATPSSSKVPPTTASTTPSTTASTSTSTTTSKPCHRDPALPIGIAGPPDKFDVAVFQNSLRIYWTRPCTQDQLLAYLLTYWQTGGKKISVKIDPTKLTHYVSTLYHPGKKFFMTIATQTTVGVGPTSRVISTYSACGYEISLKENGTFDKIHSPYFNQGYYEPDVACQWTINVPKGQRLKVEFTSLNLVTNDKCNGDFVTVNNVMFCNDLPKNGYILSENSTTTITFYSTAGSTNKHGGFKMFVSVDGIKPKNVTTKLIPGLIQVFWEAPEGKEGKPYHYDLKYRLLPETRMSEIRLNSNRHYFPITTGTHFGRQYEIDVATVDGSNGVGQKGASYKTSVRTACGHNVTVNKPGVLRSPHFPKTYEPDTVCEWNLIIEDGYQLSLSFSDLDLEVVPDCLYDYVNIVNIGTFCTLSDLYGGPLVSGSKVTTVRFVSNDATQMKGFELRYEKVPIL